MAPIVDDHYLDNDYIPPQENYSLVFEPTRKSTRIRKPNVNCDFLYEDELKDLEKTGLLGCEFSVDPILRC